MILCLVEMRLKVDIVARWALEAAATALLAEKKKKRPIAKAGPFELKRIRRCPRDDPIRDPTRTEAMTTLTSSLGVIPLAIPLTWGSSVGPARLEVVGGHLPESAQ